ncbi:hypothetical protein B7P43_G09455 [Cryptotermes secundus]|uniref:SH3 and multiple ankyrin repeat domains protein 3 n=1 Tax=Cryptotermes secundus TaxID=105785 RepID=A0A2J7R2I6_9NEOP|nr:SH3 and multiple ankyrin repeat domains protein 3 isoform X5 [Cryptotermes secundus]PNF35049.1 hypothetical protein B7P43_G09455 [Cryptotermes secundus]
MEEDAGGSSSLPPEEGYLLVRIHVPELNVQKCLQFPRDQLVWDVKQQCLAALPKELKESFNYGLFCPPVNGKAGKFLDEERRLGDYPFSGPVGYLELKYKRRVYKMLNRDEKQLKALHTRANLRRLLDYVANGQVEKITKMCSKGLDPNFHCHETGETPLTLATSIKKPSKVLIALVNGGALLDYRTRDGATAMHRSVERNNLEAVTTLLELGASPNYKDAKGLTPLYLAVTCRTDPMLCEGLLHDRAAIGAQDLQGWQEVHQACRNGLVQHLEQLLFYGADMNARNASGNTPLHVCAVNSQESCARLLLFRGCERDALNYANQTPYQVAVIAGNMELAEVIQSHRPEDVDKSLGDTSDIISDSSGVGTSNSDTTTQGSVSMPSMTVVCLENYSSGLPGHLRIAQGDIVEVTGTTDCGLLEGVLHGQGTGLLPPHCVQEVRLQQGVVPPPVLPQPPPQQPPSIMMGSLTTSRVQGRRESMHKHFATAPRLKKQLPAEPRTVVLHRARKGFGFILRGAKAMSPLMELQPSERCPALQYLDDVDQGGVADMAGLRKGDYLLAINGEDVSAASHEHVVDLIRCSGDLVSMTVVSVGASAPGGVPCSKSSTLLPGSVGTNHHRQYATLPRKMNASSTGTIGRSPAPLPPRRDPKTTLSVGRARARSMVTGLEGGGEKDEGDGLEADGLVGGSAGTTKSNSAESVHHQQGQGTGGSSTPVQPRTASIRARPTSSRITAAELEELFQRQQGSNNASSEVMTSRFQAPTLEGMSQPSSPARTPRVYTSVAEMKRCKGKSSIRVRFSTGGTELHRDFHSTPDLAQSSTVNRTIDCRVPKGHCSQEDVATLLLLSGGVVTGRPPLPPPTHPPPPPPVGQLVKVDVSRAAVKTNSTATAEYANTTNSIKMDAHPGNTLMLGRNVVATGDGEVMSSFRPANSAKLYASPEDVKSVGYRSRSLPVHSARPQVRKSHSLRSSATSFKPSSPLANSGSYSTTASTNSNPYAQPFRGATHSHINVNSSSTNCDSIKLRNKAKKKSGFTTSSSAANLSSLSVGPPPIPEPDYSLSESEGESEGEGGGRGRSQAVPQSVVVAAAEMSENSNASGSSSSSGTMPHSFSVEEIQKVRTQLKSSKSYPNDFLLLNADTGEDGDNSSSGVSSDQDVPVGPPTGFDDGRSSEGSGGSAPDEKGVKGPDFQKQTSVMVTVPSGRQRTAISGGILTRNAVSLAQLPPPLERDGEAEGELVVPPPPEFLGASSNGSGGPEEVLAPPPQFCDNRLVTRVRIVGAVPKTPGEDSHLHSH